MTEFVRVRDPETKHEATVPKKYAEAYRLEILADKEAVDSVGRPLAGKPHVELPKADKQKPAGGNQSQSGGEQK